MRFLLLKVKCSGGYEMDLNEFKQKVLRSDEEAQALVVRVTDQNNLCLLEDFITSLKIFVGFVKDDLNLSVLKNYIKRKSNNTNPCPLDNLCENVLQRLNLVNGQLENEIFDFLKSESNGSGSEIRNRVPHSSNRLIELTDSLKDHYLANILSVYEILKHLEGHEKTLVILGPNGSGKTSFANYAKTLETHIKVIPASKPIRANGHIPSIYHSTLANFNSELYGGYLPGEDLLQKLIIGLCTEHDDIARAYLDTGDKKESTYQKVKKIFDDFFEVKLNNTAFSAKKLKAEKDGQIVFDFNEMSDGERVAFFYIATVIAAPQQSFIIVDEPENHLNPAIYNKIWDRLISTRSDCQFIFISHTMDFIRARTNYELVKVKCFTWPNKFEFEFLGNALEDIEMEYMVEIVGSRKPILFCEGKKNDFDYKVYESIFGEKYTVIATGNCMAVENSVEACNMHAFTYSIQSAIGIIDSDLKTADEVLRLKEKKVYSLQCNEIEMLLLDESIFKKVLAQVYKSEEVFENFKNAFFIKINERKNHIVKRIVKTRIDEKLRSSIIDDKTNKTKESIKMNLSCIFNSLDVDAMWQEYEEELTDIWEKRDYEKALRYCCLEHTEIIGGVTDRFVENYATIALGILRDDEQVSVFIREKYFPEIDM